MKPLELIFSGLHSYCDEQHIDFRELGAHGLFGIFGPTGSGKSTILDAVTLALYGVVDRAKSNTQGIIHQGSDELHVELSFELGDRQYVVARTFQRSSSDSEGTRSRNARLHRVEDDGSVEVLADGATDTSRAVEELLGLNSGDFLKAVVLPQGKFDEFLKLTGANRGEMLERIFNLEQYGQALASKARDVRDGYDRRRELLEVRRETLGDCSDGAVQAAREALDEGRDAFGKSDEQYQLLRKEQQDFEKVKELHERFETLQKKQQEFTKQDDEIQAGTRRLDAATRAEALRMSLRQHTKLTEKIEELHEKVVSAQVAFDEAQAALGEATQQLAEAERGRDEKLPGLNDARATLKSVLDDYDRLESESSVLHAKRELQAGLVAEIAAMTVELEQEEAARQALRDEARELRRERSDLVVTPDERKEVQAALDALRRLNEAREQLEKRAHEARTRQLALRAEYESLRHLAEQELPAEQLAGVKKKDAGKFEGLARELLHGADKATEGARQALDRARLRERAGLLAVDLAPGNPCPVCGSIHHPAPAHADAEALKAAEGELQLAEVREKKLQGWVESVATRVQRWSTAQNEWDQAITAAQAANVPLVEAREAFATAWVSRTREELAEKQKDIEERDTLIGELDEKLRAVEKQLETREAAVDEEKTRLGKLRDQHARVAGELETMVKVLEGKQNHIDQVTDGANPHELLAETERVILGIEQAVKTARESKDRAEHALGDAKTIFTGSSSELRTLEDELNSLEQRLDEQRGAAGFENIEEVRGALLDPDVREALQERIEAHRRAKADVERDLQEVTGELDGRTYSADGHEALNARLADASQQRDDAAGAVAVAEQWLNELLEKQKQWKQLGKQLRQLGKRRDLANELYRLLQGRKLVQFLASEHLRDIAGEASRRLGRLTGQRYALELGDDLEFTIRDDFNGGQRRSVRTLSGGETFLVSLALALALSSKIQLKGQYPLGFFFLDEGFGTLDDERLDEVVGTLEKLHDGERMVGVISHVKELRERLLRYLEVIPAGRAGQGSQVRLRVQ